MKINYSVKEIEYKGFKKDLLVSPSYYKGIFKVTSLELIDKVTQEVKDKYYKWHHNINVGDKCDLCVIHMTKMYNDDGTPVKKKMKKKLNSSEVMILDEGRLDLWINSKRKQIEYLNTSIHEHENTIASLEKLREVICLKSNTISNQSQKDSTETIQIGEKVIQSE